MAAMAMAAMTQELNVMKQSLQNEVSHVNLQYVLVPCLPSTSTTLVLWLLKILWRLIFASCQRPSGSIPSAVVSASVCDGGRAMCENMQETFRQLTQFSFTNTGENYEDRARAGQRRVETFTG